jgi:hypothetical protein
MNKDTFGEKRKMALASKTALMSAMESAAQQAGMVVTSAEETRGFADVETTSFQLALAADPSRTVRLELSSSFAFTKPELAPQLAGHLRHAALRLRNPRPDCYVTLAGLPISLNEFRWPFHRSTSGADTHVVHGVLHLEDGHDSALHAKVAASMTLTFAEIVPAPEQPYAESFIYNAIRKTLDQGQLEFYKSGNRQTVAVTTRYYSHRQNKFIFSDTSAEQRKEFLARKLYWMSGAQGNGAPAWLADERDAQYMNTTAEELLERAHELEKNGMAKGWGDGMWSATPALMQRAPEFEAAMQAALTFTKPTFNEEMRGGHTNM